MQGKTRYVGGQIVKLHWKSCTNNSGFSLDVFTKPSSVLSEGKELFGKFLGIFLTGNHLRIHAFIGEVSLMS